MGKVTIGTTNPTKIQALEKAMQHLKINKEIISIHAQSNVSAQPIGDDETLDGAINRARNSLKLQKNSDFAIGLEGGVVFINEELYLCNWGALVDQNDKVFVAGGARIPLPSSFKAPLLAGQELGDLMDAYCQKEGIRNKEGAIGIFTEGAVSRAEMFEHVVKLLLGQWVKNENSKMM